MAKVLCVLYDDPVDGYPKTYARDDIPEITHYPDGQRRQPRAPSTSSRPIARQRLWRAGASQIPGEGRPHADCDLRQGRPDSVLEKELPDAEIVISQPFWPAYMTKERFEKAKKLKLIITAGIGSDHTDLQAAMDKNITVAEVTYCNSLSVAEHIVMMILALVRNYIPSYGWVVRGGWNIADCVDRSYDLEGMNVGTVAAGRIGLAALRRLKPFDVKLHYYDKHRLPEAVEEELNLPSTQMSSHWSRSATWSPSTRRCTRRPKHVQRQADRQDEARRLHREYGARQDLQPGRHCPRAQTRPPCRLCWRRLVPTAPTGRPSVAKHAP